MQTRLSLNCIILGPGYFRSIRFSLHFWLSYKYKSLVTTGHLWLQVTSCDQIFGTDQLQGTVLSDDAGPTCSHINKSAKILATGSHRRTRNRRALPCVYVPLPSATLFFAFACSEMTKGRACKVFNRLARALACVAASVRRCYTLYSLRAPPAPKGPTPALSGLAARASRAQAIQRVTSASCSLDSHTHRANQDSRASKRFFIRVSI